MTIYDLMTSQELAAYWVELVQDEAPYPTEELFPNDKKRGLDLKYIKGSRGLPAVLKTSAYDVKANPRDRIGFEKMTTSMPFFKESTYIDEEMRQELNMVLETGNQVYIDAVMNRVFDDETRLLRGARASRERMRMMALTTGVIAMAANGQTFTYDFAVTHKGNAVVAWSNLALSDPIEDIRLAKEEISGEEGTTVTRAMCDGNTWRLLRKNAGIIKSIYPLSDGFKRVSDKDLKAYLLEELEINIVVNDIRYVNELKVTTKFMPADTFVMFPDGDLGTTWFGTTPAESDLMSSNVANVSIVDTGVAVLTRQEADPVNVETIVSMICLPSFEQADSVYIMSTTTV